MSKQRVVFTATVEIEIEDAWGDGCQLNQVKMQARDAAVKLLRDAKLPSGIKVADLKLTRIILEQS